MQRLDRPNVNGPDDSNLLVGLFPAGFVTRCARIEPPSSPIHPLEEQIIARAVAKRQNEFRTGRHLARQALAQLGFPDFPLLMADDRRPLWPEGVLGTISHAQGICGVAVTQRSDLGGIGLDIESADAVTPDLYDLLFTEYERRWVTARTTEPHLAALIFSAKEAVYKALCSSGILDLEFSDLEITVHRDSPSFDARMLKPFDQLPGAGLPICGRYQLQERCVFSSAVLRNEGIAPAQNHRRCPTV